MKKIYAVILNLIIPFILIPNIVLADSLDSEAIFKAGLMEFKQGKFVSARLKFSEVITKYSDNENVTASYVMLSKTLFRLGEYDLAESNVLEMRRRFPESIYSEWSNYMIAACQYERGEYKKAGGILASIAGRTKSESLKNYSIKALENELSKKIEQNDYKALFEKNDLKMSLLSENKTTDEKITGNTDTFLEENNNVRNWRNEQTIKIGLVAPLTGSESEKGNELFKGVKAAFEKYPEINGKPLELLVEDTGSDKITTVLKTRYLIKEGVMAVIGPVYGESTITAAIESNASNIPFIAPTTTESEITFIGKNVFLLNTTPLSQSSAIAEYALNTLGFTTAAVITSDDFWGETVKKVFTEKFRNGGGKIIRTEMFDSDASVYNYNDILRRIRDAAPKEEITKQHSLVTSQPDSLEEYSGEQDSSIIGTEKLTPVKTIDFILISALTEDALKIANQIREYNIETTLIGDSGWNSENVPQDGGEDVEGSYLVINGENYCDSYGSEFFKDNFPQRKSELKNIISRKGYDSAAVLIHCLNKGSYSPETIVKELENVSDFNGLSCKISIDKDTHRNNTVDFIKIEKGKFTKAK